MPRLKIPNLSLYKLRFHLLYLAFGLLLVYLLIVHLTDTPYGLTPAEMQSTVTSSNLGLSNLTDNIINLPYHLLQGLSLNLFGLSVWSIKLPSLILAAITAVGLAAILRRFFAVSATTIVVFLAISSTPFLLMGRTGTPYIMLSFLTVVMVVCGAFILSLSKHRIYLKICAILAAVALLYTPLGIYPLVAFIVGTFLHPHLRHHLVKTRWHEWTALGLLGLITAAPLLFAIYNSPKLLLALFGLPESWPTWQNLLSNLSLLGERLFNVIDPSFGLIATPLFGLPLLLLMALGVLQLVRDHFSARSYVVLGWLAVFLLVLIINPQASHALDLFVPAVMLLAIGVETLINEWYSLFPKNPYARVSALLPILVLTIGISVTEITRYFDGYRYAIDLRQTQLSHALIPLKQELTETNSKQYLLTNSSNQAFYQLMTKQHTNLSVISSTTDITSGAQVIVLAEVKGYQPPNQWRIIDFQATPWKTQPIAYTIYQT